MALRLLLATLHLVALGVGLGSVWARSRALREPLDRAGLRRVFAADTWWAVAAILWIGTGLARMLLSTEKPLLYYMMNHVFMAKLGLFILVFVIELWPMVTLVRWRLALARGAEPDTRAAKTLATVSAIEALLIVAIVAAAVAMARGLGVFSPGVRG
jgi:putative membrane protein